MNSLGLIIQRTNTNAGFNDVFISDNLKDIRNSVEIENTAKDEREFSTKLANQSDVYVVELTKNYRVYSLIINDNIYDSFGRAGFYAIRLYTEKKYPLANFEERLHLINKKYLEFEKNGIAKNSQDYSELLVQNMLLEVKQQDYIYQKSNINAFCFYDPNNTQLSNLFNSKGIALYNKIYAFDKEKAVSGEIIQSIGLKIFDSTQNNLKEVIFNNNYLILKELKVNNIPLDFKADETEFSVLIKNEDVLEYNTKDNPTFKKAIGFIIHVERKQIVIPQQDPNRGKKKPSFWAENGIYLATLFLTIALGGGAWYIFSEDEKIDEENQIVNEQPQNVKNEVKKDSITITFVADGSVKDSSVFKTNYPKLEKYRFRLDNKKWSYKNTEKKNGYVVFYKSNLDEIIKKDSLNLNQSQKNSFIENLEKIGKQEILDKEDSIQNSSEKNKADTKTKKKSETSKKEVSKEDKKENESDSESQEKFKTKKKIKTTNE
ncbi:MAG: hypothetical protein E6Q79_00450 [Romboutsia sp.]|nr:MAG: hypothetical protein E6Q79_00450 [Romboutsia sp.]